MSELYKSNRKKTFIITSPKLAGRLLYAGLELRETVNPFHPDRLHAWELTLDNTSVNIIKEFYEEIQRAFPYVIARWSEGPDPEEVNQNG